MHEITQALPIDKNHEKFVMPNYLHHRLNFLHQFVCLLAASFNNYAEIWAKFLDSR